MRKTNEVTVKGDLIYTGDRPLVCPLHNDECCTVQCAWLTMAKGTSSRIHVLCHGERIGILEEQGGEYDKKK